VVLKDTIAMSYWVRYYLLCETLYPLVKWRKYLNRLGRCNYDGIEVGKSFPRVHITEQKGAINDVYGCNTIYI